MISPRELNAATTKKAGSANPDQRNRIQRRKNLGKLNTVIATPTNSTQMESAGTTDVERNLDPIHLNGPNHAVEEIIEVPFLNN